MYVSLSVVPRLQKNYATALHLEVLFNTSEHGMSGFLCHAYGKEETHMEFQQLLIL